MHLPPAGREYYALRITTEPAAGPTAWQASFDDGTTWVAAIAHPDDATASAWLVQGPDADASQPTAVELAATTEPQVRLIDNPEVVIRRAPTIYLGME